MNTNVRAWLAGILAAFITGGSSAVTAGFASTLITPESYNLKAGLGHVVQLMIATFVISGLLGAFHRLQSSPLPSAWIQESTTESHSTTTLPSTGAVVEKVTVATVKTTQPTD